MTTCASLGDVVVVGFAFDRRERSLHVSHVSPIATLYAPGPTNIDCMLVGITVDLSVDSGIYNIFAVPWPRRVLMLARLHETLH